MERVYEIGKDFRNEGFSWKHSPEFTMLELYQAYVDYNDIMELTENMTADVAQRVVGTTKVTFNDHEIDLAPPWTRMTIRNAVLQYSGIDLEICSTVEELTAAALDRGLELAPGAPRGQVIEEIVSELVEPKLIQPTFLVDFPIDFPGSLLAKRKEGSPDIAERFEIYLGGFELGNAFTELNEPADQLARMESLAAETGAAVDLDYVRALEQGMPPTGGIGIGIDRLVMVLAGVHNVRETILFPLLRQREEVHA
jgi:lysyl-tRNA synthetase class 2